MKQHGMLWGIGLLAGVFLTLFSVCAWAEERAVIAVSNLPGSMDPHREASDDGISCLSNIFEGLVQRIGPRASLAPSLAVRWEHPDQETWKFFLRRSVVFHNGNPFTADDVKFTLLRLSVSDVPCLKQIGRSIDFINILDPWTLTVRTRNAVPWFVNMMPKVFIMDRESTIGRNSEDVARFPVGTGAYRLKSLEAGSHLSLAVNKDYWGGEPDTDSVRFVPVNVPEERLAAVTSGSANIATAIPIDLYPKARTSQHVDIAALTGRRSVFLSLGNRYGTPLADVRVRRAMYMAIDETAIVENIMNGHARASAQVPDPYAAGYNEKIARIAYDPETARRLLAEVGYDNGFDTTLCLPEGRYVRGKEIAAAVAKDLERIGIRVSVNPLPVADFFQALVDGKLNFYLIGWSDGVFDMGRSYLLMGHSRENRLGYLNGAGFSSESFDRLLETTLEITDGRRRLIVLKQLSKMAMTDLIPWIPLHYEMDLYAVAKEPVIGFYPRPDRWIVCKEFFVDGAGFSGLPPF